MGHKGNSYERSKFAFIAPSFITVNGPRRNVIVTIQVHTVLYGRTRCTINEELGALLLRVREMSFPSSNSRWTLRGEMNEVVLRTTAAMVQVAKMLCWRSSKTRLHDPFIYS